MVHRLSQMWRQCRYKVEIIHLGSAHEKYSVWTWPHAVFWQHQRYGNWTILYFQKAWENRQLLLTLPLVSPLNDIWEIKQAQKFHTDDVSLPRFG